MEADQSSKSNYLESLEQLTDRREPTLMGGAETGVWQCHGARPALITSSCKDHLQKNICLLDEMQLDGSFILSQSSELIEKGFYNECIWFHSSY